MAYTRTCFHQVSWIVGANSSTASTCFRVTPGNHSTNSSMVAPSSRFSKSARTGTRVLAKTQAPLTLAGSVRPQCTAPTSSWITFEETSFTHANIRAFIHWCNHDDRPAGSQVGSRTSSSATDEAQRRDRARRRFRRRERLLHRSRVLIGDRAHRRSKSTRDRVLACRSSTHPESHAASRKLAVGTRLGGRWRSLT